MAVKCPYCHNIAAYAEFVATGVGQMQCSPYGCEVCHSYEINILHAETEEEKRTGWHKGEFYQDVMQRHCNYMLSMRRMFKGLAVVMQLSNERKEENAQSTRSGM